MMMFCEVGIQELFQYGGAPYMKLNPDLAVRWIEDENKQAIRIMPDERVEHVQGVSGRKGGAISVSRDWVGDVQAPAAD